MTKQRVFPWLVFFLGSLFVLYQFLLQSANSVMVTPLMRDLNANLTDIGFLTSTFFYPYVLLQIPAGILVDRFGARVLMSLGLLICAFAALLFAFTNHLNEAVYTRLLMGVASSPGVVGVMYLACRWFPKARFALLASIAEMMGMLGGAVGEGVLAHLVSHFGWRHAMIAVSILGLILALVSILIIRDKPQDLIEACPRKSIKNIQHALNASLRTKAVWSGCLYGGFSFSVISGFGSLWSVPFLQEVYAYTIEESALISSMLFIGAAVGAYLAGMLACHFENIKSLMLSSALISFLCMVLIVFVPQTKLTNFILFFLQGLSSGFYVLAFCHVKNNICETISASAMGLTNMVCLVMGALLQPVVGHLLSYLTTKNQSSIMVYKLGMLPFILTLFLAVVIAINVKKVKGNP